MANEKHLALLRQGVPAWNQWRLEHPEIQPDLSGANLQGAVLPEANLSKANLEGANLRAIYLGSREERMPIYDDLLKDYDYRGVILTLFNEANLSNADLRGVDLSHTRFRGAKLRGAKLNDTHFCSTDLTEVDLSKAELVGANLKSAILDRAKLNNANLSEAILNETHLGRADLSGATMRGTLFSNINLREVKGLDTVIHWGPSSIGIDTIYRSQGQIPKSFLRKAGVPASFLEVMAAITNRSIEYYTCFISYSSKDQDFAERLYADLQNKGVRCWSAYYDMKIGDKIRSRIDESIRLYDKLLLVLSEHSVASQWVEQEVETALEKERKEKRTVLFPICLDEAVMGIEGGWPALIRNTRNIGDFIRWKQHDAYQKALDRLLRDLKAETAQTEK